MFSSYRWIAHETTQKDTGGAECEARVGGRRSLESNGVTDDVTDAL
jgi:hypothetical protein